jgi:hypothetical protein
MYDPSKILSWIKSNVQGMRLSRCKTLAAIVSAALQKRLLNGLSGTKKVKYFGRWHKYLTRLTKLAFPTRFELVPRP